jgi:galactokinase
VSDTAVREGKVGDVAANLIEAGMSAPEAKSKANLFTRCEAALQTSAGENAQLFRWYVPGRVEFLGKHTDYCGGRSLLCDVERGFCIIARPRNDHHVNVHALDLDENVSFDLTPELTPENNSWRNYVMTVARRVARNFPPQNGKALRGADIAFASDLPPAAGMSSSSALIIAIFLALSDVNCLDTHPAYRANIHSIEDFAGYMGTNENGQTFGTLVGDRGVGTFGGSQDHTAILLCQPDRLSQYSFCPVRHEATMPWPKGHALVIGVSGVLAEKTGAALEQYNLVSRRAAAIVELWQRITTPKEATVAAIINTSPTAADQLRALLAPGSAGGSPETAKLRLAERLEQFLTESNHIIPETAQAIATNQLDRLGPLIDLSQKNAETLLGNQVPETIALCKIARTHGALAASAFGAGFGGAVWALVPEKNVANFVHQWRNQYNTQFPNCAKRSNFLITRPGPAARRV